jgi:hypothetical protein
MWVAYLIPKDDYHLVVEDGIGYLVKGETQEVAIANLREKFQADNDPSDPDYSFENDYVLHTEDLG